MDLLTIAKNIAEGVEAESLRQHVPVAVTVIDRHGNVVLVHRMTGAPAFSLDLSERKAYTSALVGMRTADLVSLVQPGAELYPLLAVSGGRYSAMGGGVRDFEGATGLATAPSTRRRMDALARLDPGSNLHAMKPIPVGVLLALLVLPLRAKDTLIDLWPEGIPGQAANAPAGQNQGHDHDGNHQENDTHEPGAGEAHQHQRANQAQCGAQNDG